MSSHLKLSFPPEPVARKNFHWWWPLSWVHVLQAQPIPFTGVIHGPDDWMGEITGELPLCNVHRTKLGHFLVDAVEAEGKVKWSKRSHHG